MGRGCPWLLAVVLIATASHAGVGRCLDEDERILGSPFVSTIVVEANAWDSSMIAASIGRILIEELLGYRVVMNWVRSNDGVYRRASLDASSWIEGDGEVLRDMLENGERFGYVCLEVWEDAQVHDMDWYERQKGRVWRGGRIGYFGRNGIYVPARFAEPPYGLEFYRSLWFNESNAASRLLVDTVQRSSYTVNCSSSTACHCCPILPESCDVWCPTVADQSEMVDFAPLPVLKQRAFSNGILESIIENNNFSMGIRYFEGLSDIEYRVEIEKLMDSPVAFFHWVPSLTVLHLDVKRVLLPQEEWCGNTVNRGDGLSSWRCDFMPEHLVKIASANLERDAPLLVNLIQSLRVSHEENFGDLLKRGEIPRGNLKNTGILRLLAELESLSAQRHGVERTILVEEVACEWLKSNRHIWKSWVSREIPDWADMSNIRTFLMVLVVSVTSLFFVVAVWERCWLGTGMVGKTCWDSCNCWIHQRRLTDLPEQESVRWGGKSLQERIQEKRSGLLLRSGKDSASDSRRAVFTDVRSSSRQQACVLRPPVSAGAVDFRSPEWKVLPRGGQAMIWVDRTGCLDGKVVVHVHAHAGDAKAGVHYDFPEEGFDCVFEPGQSTAGIPVEAFFVPTIGPDYADQRLFYLELTHVVSGNAVLALPGAVAHIRIASTGQFLGDDVESFNPRRLVRRWISVLIAENRWSFCRATTCSIWESFHYVFVKTLSLQVLVDFVLGRELYWMAPCVIVLYILSTLILRWAQHAFIIVSRQGPITANLRGMVYKKFWRLAMHQHFREAEQHAKWITSLVRVKEVTDAWLTVFAIIRNVAAIVFSAAVLMIVTTQWGTETLDRPRLLALACLFVLEVVAFLFIFRTHRAQHQSDLVEQGEMRLDTLVEQFVWTLRSWPIITEQRPHMHRVEAVLEEFMDTNAECRDFVRRGILTGLTSSWIAEYFTCAFSIFFMFYGVLAAADRAHSGQGAFSVGSYVALVAIVNKHGDATTQIYLGLLSFNRSGAVLRTLRDLLWLSEDELELYGASCAVCRAPQHEGADLNLKSAPRRREGLRRAPCPAAVQSPGGHTRQYSPRAGDSEPVIALDRVSFQYHPRLPMVLSSCSAQVPLGRAYAICGPRNSGKLTLLRVLSHGLAPTSGSVALPAPLRVSLLDGTANFIPGLSVVDNMKLGILSVVSDDDLSVLCRALPLYGFSPSGGPQADALRGPTTCCTSFGAFYQRNGSTGSVTEPAELVPHLTAREQFTMQLARALLRDADLLLVNFREMPEDEWTARLYLILCVWQLAGGFVGLVRELRSLEAAESQGSLEQHSGEDEEPGISRAASAPSWRSRPAAAPSCFPSAPLRHGRPFPSARLASGRPARACIAPSDGSFDSFPSGRAGQDSDRSPFQRAVSSPGPAVTGMLSTLSAKAEVKAESLRETWKLVPLASLAARVGALSGEPGTLDAARAGGAAVRRKTLVVLPSDASRLLASVEGQGFTGLIRLSGGGLCEVVDSSCE